ncbi:thioredoxin domain-containing protein 9-like [Pollicipes pollicipes]|uniref:thioredoxin domain-containing protein 9-like n=1 Tax=Pollicipes pollicipes TaxID=41117 RepID=UPI001884AED2|nr:thioredoxin domain-containing protein 9-like [Pollicipes pollicipes]XP_037088024.1 thioredoxin domain-containing protein 9-like [Pollicipes pollicipes]XP_037088242.1 thioredoxin domain-containing protein 9-like [Pollicipes pollicipes]XP_037088243.1 thioredoxin domain-containing protein 9-like [Pollicipes pollicipes]
METAMQAQLVSAAQQLEQQLDDEISRLDRLDTDDLETIRRQRIQEMKRMKEKRHEWHAQGHGQYTEIPEEKDFFEVPKKSENVVCHFYRDDFFRCKIVDKHLNSLAKKHMETKFVKINAEKCPFLTQRLKIKVLPTIALVKDAKTKDFIVGFADLGNNDEFSTDLLEWRIAQAGVIDYSGDLLTPPDPADRKSRVTQKKKTIRGRDQDDSDSD